MNTGGPNLKRLKKKKPFIAIKKIKNFYCLLYYTGWVRLGDWADPKKKENGAISNRYDLLIEKTSFFTFPFLG